MAHDPKLVESVARAVGKAGAGPGDGSLEHWNALQQWQRDYQIKKATAALDAIEGRYVTEFEAGAEAMRQKIMNYHLAAWNYWMKLRRSRREESIAMCEIHERTIEFLRTLPLPTKENNI